MKQQRVIFICTLLIITLALTIINPLDTVAQQHGNVIIGGQVFYQPRYWNGSNWGIGKEIQVDLYEKDLQGNNHRLTTTYTNSSGFFVFPSMINWWEPDNRQLNIFFVVQYLRQLLSLDYLTASTSSSSSSVKSANQTVKPFLSTHSTMYQEFLPGEPGAM